MTKFRRRAQDLGIWLLPGLLIKRWISLSVLGFVCVAFGMALAMNLQPITLTYVFFKRLAAVMPSFVAGPLLIFLGVALWYLGTRGTLRSVFSAISPESQQSGLLEALYRNHKLSQGPKVVLLGGGTGLSTILRGMKHFSNNLTAIVTVGDDGGSSGRLREEQGVIPPGDIRNCLAALADEETLLTELFQYRFKTGDGLEGHSFGNLFLTAMAHISGGDMLKAVQESSKVLNIRGTVLPSSLDHVQLVATMKDGTVISGESKIPESAKEHGGIATLACTLSDVNSAACPQALGRAVLALQEADLIILGPGSLYTSVLPNLLLHHIALAVVQSTAPKVYIANIMTQPGETDNMSVSQHIDVLRQHVSAMNIKGKVVDAVLVNNGLDPDLLERYQAHGYAPVELDTSVLAQQGIEVISAALLDPTQTQTIRHQPIYLARAIMRWFRKQSADVIA